MSRGDPYRSSTGSLSTTGGGGGGRWDPERFYRERDHYERGHGRVVDERDIVDRAPGRYFEEHDRFEEDYGRRSSGEDRFAPRPQVAASARFDRGHNHFGGGGGGGVRTRVEEDKIQFRFQDGDHGRDRRASLVFEDDHEAATRSAMIPYRPREPRGRRQSIHIERDYVSPPPVVRGPPPRPKFIRRQSSLDTHDRRPMPRYGDQEDYRDVVTVPLTPRRRRSPVRRFEEREYHEIHVADSDYSSSDHGEFRAKERTRRSYRFRVDDDVGEVQGTLRRGKTRLPRRLVEKTAIDLLGYPFVEELDHIVVQKALDKAQIDEVVMLSKQVRTDRTKYVKEEVKLIEAVPAPPPPPPMETIQRTEIVLQPPEPAPMEIVKQTIRTEEVAPPPAPSVFSDHTSLHAHSHGHGHAHRRRKSKRRKSRRRANSSSSSSSSSTMAEEVIIKTIEQSEPVRGPFTGGLSVHKDERTINREIKALDREEKALEIEKKALKLERQRDAELRKAERVREARLDSSTQVDLGGIKVERNKKGKMYMVKS